MIKSSELIEWPKQTYIYIHVHICYVYTLYIYILYIHMYIDSLIEMPTIHHGPVDGAPRSDWEKNDDDNDDDDPNNERKDGHDMQERCATSLHREEC